MKEAACVRDRLHADQTSLLRLHGNETFWLAYMFSWHQREVRGQEGGQENESKSVADQISRRLERKTFKRCVVKWELHTMTKTCK